MVTLRLFAQLREIAGTNCLEIDGDTVSAVIDNAKEKFGAEFSQVLEHSKIWLNGEPTTLDDTVDATSEIAILPPVSGG